MTSAIERDHGVVVLALRVDAGVLDVVVDAAAGKTEEEIAAWEAWRVARILELADRIARSRAAAARHAQVNLIAPSRAAPRSGETADGMHPRGPPAKALALHDHSKLPNATSEFSNASSSRRRQPRPRRRRR